MNQHPTVNDIALLNKALNCGYLAAIYKDKTITNTNVLVVVVDGPNGGFFRIPTTKKTQTSGDFIFGNDIHCRFDFEGNILIFSRQLKSFNVRYIK